MRAEAEETCPSAGADRPLPFCFHLLNLICPFHLRHFSIGRLLCFGTGPLRSEVGSGDSEGARLESADVGVESLAQAQTARVSTLWGWRGGPQGTGPSAALGRVAPEERLSTGQV